MADNNVVKKQDKEYREYINAAIEHFNSNGKKTVVYFCDCYYPVVDGVIKVLENYAKRVSKYYNVVIIAPKHKNKIIDSSDDFLLIGVAGLFIRFVNYDLAFPKLDSYLKPFLDNLKIDIIHSHSPFTMGAYAAKYATKRHLPFVMTMHSQYKLDFMRYVKIESLSQKLAERLCKVFNQSTETWTMHNGVAQALKSYGYRGKFYFVPNATDYPLPQNVEELKLKAQQKYNINPDEKVLLFVGRLVQQKNILFTADVLKIVKDNGIKFKAIFVGDGPDENSLRNKIDELGLNDDVILTGRIDSREALSEIYALSDLFLFPSLYDTSSLVQIEAAVHYTPGVFIENTVTSATITDGQNGFLSPNDVQEYAKIVTKVLKDENLLKTVGKNARQDLYVTWDDLTERICARYEFLIKDQLNLFE